MSFQLPSLHLGTEFDEPTHALALPGSVSRGNHPALVLLDGASRAPKRLSRVVRRTALLALKIDRPTGPIRVSVALMLDAISTEVWRHISRVEPEEMPDETGRHRLVEVSIQGLPRAVLLLGSRPGADRDSTKQRVSAHLQPEEIGESGLLAVDFKLPDHLPAWAREGLLEEPVAGVCVNRVLVEPLAGHVAPSLSTSVAPQRRWHPVPTGPGFFVVNPGSALGPVRVQLRAAGPKTRPGVLDRVISRFHRVRGRDVSSASKYVELEVQPVAGGASRRAVLQLGEHATCDLALEPGELPAYLRILDSPAWAPTERSGWTARVHEAQA